MNLNNNILQVKQNTKHTNTFTQCFLTEVVEVRIYLFIHFCVGRFHASDCNFVIETKKFDLPANPAGGQGAKAPAGTCAAGEWGCAT